MSSIQTELAEVMPELTGAISHDSNQQDLELVQLESSSKMKSQNQLFDDIEAQLNVQKGSDLISFLKENKNKEKSGTSQLA